MPSEVFLNHMAKEIRDPLLHLTKLFGSNKFVFEEIPDEIIDTVDWMVEEFILDIYNETGWSDAQAMARILLSNFSENEWVQFTKIMDKANLTQIQAVILS